MENKKEAVFIKNFIYQDELVEKKIRPVMKDPKEREALLNFTGQFINEHHKELSTPGPVYMFTFGDKETDFLYNKFNTSKEEILALINRVTAETYKGKLSLPLVGLIKNAPHKILITAIIVDALQNDYKDIVICCEYLMGFADYPMVFRSSWKLGVNEAVMNYTIEHLPNKFKIKAKGIMNLLGLIFYDMENEIKLCGPRLITGEDNTYIDYIYRVRNQMKSTFQKIAEQYYENQKNNAVQYTTGDQNEEGKLMDQEGIMTNISSVVDKVYSKLIRGDINKELAKVVADSKNEVSPAILINYISKILANGQNRLYEFIENIVRAYFVKYGSTDIDYTFLNFAFGLYVSLTRSTDPLFMNISEILDLWTKDIAGVEKDYTRPATIINYKICIYRYFVMMINHYN